VKTFAQFRAELADAVTVAINSGLHVYQYRSSGNAPDEICPLGSKTRTRHPCVVEARKVWRVPESWIQDFMEAFDCSVLDNSGSEAYKLGAAYRKRFVRDKP
jgi:hypothetical protein